MPTKTVAKKAAKKVAAKKAAAPKPLFSDPELEQIDNAVRPVNPSLADRIAPVLKSAVGTPSKLGGGG